MEPFPTFPENKRHAMHYRQTPPDFITARFPNPKVQNLSPGNVEIYQTPDSIADALDLSERLPRSYSQDSIQKTPNRLPTKDYVSTTPTRYELVDRPARQAHESTSTTRRQAYTSPHATPPRPPPKDTPHTTPTKANESSHTTPSRHPLPRSQSSSWWMEIRKSPSPSKWKQRSRKTSEATIHTDATETQPAFESDAFAVHMPTTREPILDTPVLNAPVFRAKLPSPSKAQVDAYQTYKQKANLVRDRNWAEGVRVPSKIVSYDYACAEKEKKKNISSEKGIPMSRRNNFQKEHEPLEVELDISPPSSPPDRMPASFPISPPIPQHGWAQPVPQQEQQPQKHVQGPRSMSEGGNHFVTNNRKPVRLVSNNNIQPNTSRSRYNRERADTDSGAAAPIKLRVKPKPEFKLFSAKNEEREKIQKESSWNLYNRSPQTSSVETSPTKLKFAHTTIYPKPEDEKPNFIYTTNPVQALFGYHSNDIAGTVAGAPNPNAKLKSSKVSKEKPDKEETPAAKTSTSTSRWAWLRPNGPRVSKPTATTATNTATAFSSLQATQAAQAAAKKKYIDPFITHASPSASQHNTPFSFPLPQAQSQSQSRPTSPTKKLHRTPPQQTTKKFETGFAQVKSLTLLILKICLIIYALVGLYFLLDAVREAARALGAPFRGMRVVGGWVWVVGNWGWKWVAKGWERWGVRVAWKRGWRWF